MDFICTMALQRYEIDGEWQSIAKRQSEKGSSFITYGLSPINGYLLTFSNLLLQLLPGMMVLVRMAVDDGIGHRKNGSGHHQSQGRQIDTGQLLLQENEGQESADERGGNHSPKATERISPT